MKTARDYYAEGVSYGLLAYGSPSAALIRWLVSAVLYILWRIHEKDLIRSVVQERAPRSPVSWQPSPMYAMWKAHPSLRKRWS